MKQRLISAGIGLVIFAVIMLGFNTIVFDIAICVVSLIAVHELLLALGVTKNVPLTVVSLVSVIFPFVMIRGFIPNRHILVLIAVSLISIMFLILLKYHETIQIQTVASAFFVSIIVPMAFLTLVLIRNEYNVMNAIFYVLLIFACSWGADSGAYFGGRFFGKHKLAPKISPKKTVEGVWGGVVGSVVIVSIISGGMYFIANLLNVDFTLHIYVVLIISIICSFVSVLGDLTASVIKRQCGIKDFGSIIPGHGGIMDRFDSVLFTAPFIYVLLQLFII